MAEAAIGTDFDQPLDVHGSVFPQITFHVALSFDRLADAVDLVLIQVLDLLHGFNFRDSKQTPGTRVPNPVNVRQRDVHVLVARKIDACNTRHNIPLKSLDRVEAWLRLGSRSVLAIARIAMIAKIDDWRPSLGTTSSIPAILVPLRGSNFWQF